MPKATKFDPSRWFICTLSKSGFHNWDLCKEVGLWGIPTNGRNVGIPELKHGDGLIVYAATRGIKAFCEVVGEVRRPKDKQEAPWAGGVFRYGLIFPIRVVMEFDQPIPTQFSSQKLQGTSITTSQLRRGFSSIKTGDGKYLLSTLSKKKRD